MIRFLCVASLLVAPALSQQPEPPVVNAVPDIFHAFPPDQQKLGGIIGSRLRANSEGYVEHSLAGGELTGSPEAGGRDDRGTLLDAAVAAFEYSHDASVNAVIAALVKSLAASQQRDGYVGAQTEGRQWTAQDTLTQSAILRGLLNYYRLTGVPSALSICTKIGGLFIKERLNSSADPGSLALALEPMAELFRFTDDRRYLEFCDSVAESWLRSKRSELEVTYQNLAVLNGLIELYRVTGDNSVFAAPLKAWTEMQTSGLALTGVPAKGVDRDLQSLDACSTSAWLELSLNLLRITGQPLYAEQVERTIYNQLFADQDPRSGAVLAPALWNGKKEPATAGACAANEARAVALLPATVWGRYGNGIAVNLYSNGRATLKLRRRGTIQLYSEAPYPQSGSITLHVEPDHPLHFPLRLRVPQWTDKFTADIGPDHYVGRPGEYPDHQPRLEARRYNQDLHRNYTSSCARN